MLRLYDVLRSWTKPIPDAIIETALKKDKESEERSQSRILKEIQARIEPERPLMTGKQFDALADKVKDMSYPYPNTEYRAMRILGRTWSQDARLRQAHQLLQDTISKEISP